MAWWRWPAWIGNPFRATDAAKLAEIYGSEDGEIVNPETAMRISAYFAGVRLISQIIAAAPIGIFQKLPNGDRAERPDHPLFRLLHDSPNADQTALEFWEGRVMGLCTCGHGYAEKVMGNGGRLIPLEPMPADTYRRKLENGKWEYRYYEDGKERVLPEDSVFHIRAFGGLSPVGHARNSLSLSMATDRASRQTFSRGMRAKGFFTSPATLTQPQRDQAQKSLIEPFSGPNGKDWGILEGGFDVKTVNISPRDAELILSRKFNIEDICRWLGVPPMMIGHAGDGTTMWGTGIEQIMLGFYKTTLVPYLERIEQRIGKSLLTPADRADGIYAEFNVEALLRGDSASVTANLASQIQNGMRKPNEARVKLNLPPADGGDKLLVNSTLVPLAQAGQAGGAADQVAKNALRAWLGIKDEPVPKDRVQ